MVSIKLVQLNVEGSFHLENCLPFIANENPDVVCLQEVYEHDWERIKGKIRMDGVFAPMTRVTPAAADENQQRNPGSRIGEGLIGVAVLTKQPCEFELFYYDGSENIPVHPEKSHPLAIGKLQVGGKVFIVCTTHFVWTPQGSYTPYQQSALASLLSYDLSDAILVGDFNAPRPREVYQELVKQFTDNVPSNIVSTIDPVLHRSKGLSLVVDYVFTTPQYTVTNIRVVEGVSDHKAIVATIERD